MADARSLAGRGSVDELVAATGLGGRDGARGADRARGARARRRGVRALPARRAARAARSGAATAGARPRRRGRAPAADRSRRRGRVTRRPAWLPDRGRRCYPPPNPGSAQPPAPARLPVPSRRGRVGRRERDPAHGGDVLRKLGATLLAVPVLVVVYLASLREPRRRATGSLAGLGAAAVIALVAMASLPPAPSAAVPRPAPAARRRRASSTPSAPGTRLTDADSRSTFDAPMDAASVAAALRISPDSAVSFAWDAAGRVLTIAPDRRTGSPTPCTRSRSTRSARSEARRRASQRRSAPLVLTARPGPRRIAATRVGRRAASAPTPRSRSRSTGRVRSAAVRAALRTEPAVAGDARARGDDRRVPVHARASRLARDAPTASRSRASSTPTASPFATPPALDGLDRRGPVRRPVPAARRDARGRPRPRCSRSASPSRWTARATAEAFTVTAGGKRVAGHDRLGRGGHGARLPSRRRRSPTARRS